MLIFNLFGKFILYTYFSPFACVPLGCGCLLEVGFVLGVWLPSCYKTLSLSAHAFVKDIHSVFQFFYYNICTETEGQRWKWGQTRHAFACPLGVSERLLVHSKG